MRGLEMLLETGQVFKFTSNGNTAFKDTGIRQSTATRTRCRCIYYDIRSTDEQKLFPKT
jgi:hypothetical protein